MNARNGNRGRVPWPSQGSRDPGHETLAERQTVAYSCRRGHDFTVVFLAGILPPAEWECRCGQPAGLGQASDTESELERRLVQVHERRSAAELEQLLSRRLSDLRGAGQVQT